MKTTELHDFSNLLQFWDSIICGYGMERGGLPQEDMEKRETSRDSQKELVPAGGTITHPRFTELQSHA